MPDPIHQILSLITRKPFRRTSIDEDTSKDIFEKISRYGVRFSIPFGGYKSRWLPHSPSINWAEVFWLDYLRQYAEPMRSWIDKDIDFAFTYMSGVLGFINGISTQAQETYLQELDCLMQYMSGDGIRFRLVDLAEQVGGASKALSQVMANYERLKASPPAMSNSKLLSATRNNDGHTHPADAALRCEALEILPTRRAFNKYGQHIQLTHIRGSSLSVHIGSCRSSVVQPWVGVGVVEQRNNVFTPRILGRSGYERKLIKEIDHNALTLGMSPGVMIAVEAFPHLRKVPVVESDRVSHDDV